MNISINPDTILCISIASRPGQMGMAMHNAAYQALGLDFVYKSFKVSDLKGALAGARALGIRGISVTMPFKETVLPYLDHIDPMAQAIGAVNTIVNDQEKLTGYNTDFEAAKIIIGELNILAHERVLVLGAGGAARAILAALHTTGVKQVACSNRTPEKAKQITAKFNYETVPWENRNKEKSDIIINATPLGMTLDIDQLPVTNEALSSCRAIFDTVINPAPTPFIKSGIQSGKQVIEGFRMGIYQAAKQFELYTGHPAPLAVMEQAAISLRKS